MNSFDTSAQKAKLDALRNRFSQQKPSNSNQRDKALFKAKLGQPQIIRIVPVADGDIPIRELKFYYNTEIKEQVGDRMYNISILSPSSYGESDPIEMFTEMFQSENSDEYKNLNPDVKTKILGQLRQSSKFFIPVIVRGMEDQGVKYWGLTEKLLQSLLDNIEKEGHLIYDPLKGRDMKVWIEDMGNYKQTKFELGRMSELSDNEVSRNAFISNQPDLISQFNKKTFTELKDIINQILAPYSSPPAQEESQETPGRDYTAIREAAPEVAKEEEPVVQDDPFDDLPF